jgi:HSP20 family protein
MLMRFDPFRELDRLTAHAVGGTRQFTGFMPMDAYRRGERFFVHLDLPGVSPDSIELTVERNVLTVKAERRFEPTEGDELVVTERPRGTVTRQLFLGENLDTERIEAAYEHGVLTVTIPVAETARARRIHIGGGSGERKAVEATSTAA